MSDTANIFRPDAAPGEKISFDEDGAGALGALPDAASGDEDILRADLAAGLSTNFEEGRGIVYLHVLILTTVAIVFDGGAAIVFDGGAAIVFDGGAASGGLA